MSDVDARVLSLAATQLDLVTLRQLRDGGLSKSQVYGRVRSGTLRTIHRQVFATTHAPLKVEQRAMAACLVGGVEAFASHATALALLDLLDTEEGLVEITVPFENRVRVTGIRAYRSDITGPRERSRRGPLMISRPGRALIDTAGRFVPDDLERLVDRTLRTRVISPHALHVETCRPEFANRPRIGLLRRIAFERIGEGPPESELEVEMVRLLRRFKLPEPVRQYRVRVRGRDVRYDFAYPDVRLAVEVRGWGPRYGLDEWQRENDRRYAVDAESWRMLEFTWRDVTDRPWTVVSRLADALGIRPTRWTRPKDSKLDTARSE